MVYCPLSALKFSYSFYGQIFQSIHLKLLINMKIEKIKTLTVMTIRSLVIIPVNKSFSESEFKIKRARTVIITAKGSVDTVPLPIPSLYPPLKRYEAIKPPINGAKNRK